MEVKKKNLAIFISGQGSNLEIILKNKKKFQSLFVVSSKADAYGIQRAKEHQVPHLVLDVPIDWDALQEKLIQNKTDQIFLAGFMKIVPESFVSQWIGRLFNLHPSMLPKYKGLKAIERAYAAEDDVGVTIHHVVPEVDAGEIVLQEKVLSGEEIGDHTLEQVVAMTHAKEHQLVQRWVDLHAITQEGN